MKSNEISYNFENSKNRLDEILDSSDYNYEEVSDIPSRDKLTFTNGFYYNCSALFVDIRGSSELPNKHKRKVLAKIYRSYISEVVAVLNGDSNCVEINIHGDSVWGIFNTRYKSDINILFETAGRVSSLIDTLNCKLEKRKITPITVGVGLDYGRALMIKAGYKGSNLNEVVYMGEVVNNASNLCGYGNKGFGDAETMVSEVFYENLKDDYKKLLSWNSIRSCYHGNIINSEMNTWLSNNNC